MIKEFNQNIANQLHNKLKPTAEKIKNYQLNGGPAPTDAEMSASIKTVNEYYKYLIDCRIPYGQAAYDVVNDQGNFGKLANKYFDYQAITEVMASGRNLVEIIDINAQYKVLLANDDARIRSTGKITYKNIADYHYTNLAVFGLSPKAWGGTFFEEYAGSGSWMDIGGYDTNIEINKLSMVKAVLFNTKAHGAGAREYLEIINNVGIDNKLDTTGALFTRSLIAGQDSIQEVSIAVGEAWDKVKVDERALPPEFTYLRVYDPTTGKRYDFKTPIWVNKDNSKTDTPKDTKINTKALEAEILKKCGPSNFNEKPSTEKAAIDYSAAFDMSSQVDSTMQITKGCKSDPKNNDPHKMVPYEVPELKYYYGCGTQLGWLLQFRNFDAACEWAKQYPIQIDKPFIIERGGVISKGHFLLNAIKAYDISNRINPKYYTDCLDLALQNTGNIDMVTATQAKNAYPTIFKLITSYSLNQPTIMEKFFAKGVNVNLPSCDTSKCQTALGYAVQSGNEQLTKMLLEHGANPNLGTYYNATQTHTPPLQTAFASYANNKYNLLKTLLEHDADLKEGTTAKGVEVKSNEHYYSFMETAYKNQAIDEESYQFFRNKFGRAKIDYDKAYNACKIMVTNEFNEIHMEQPKHDEL